MNRAVLSRLRAMLADWRTLTLLCLLLTVLGLMQAAILRPAPPRQRHVARVVDVNTVGQDSRSFLNGVRLAIQDVNRSGGVAGVPLVLEVVNEPAFSPDISENVTVNRIVELARSVSRRNELIAVIGHDTSAAVVPAASVYNRSGTLFLATHATAEALADLHLDMVFEIQPDDVSSAAVIARYAREHSMRRFVVLSDRSAYATEYSKLFRNAVTVNGGEILFNGLLSGAEQSVDRVLLFLLNNRLFSATDIDAIFIVSNSSGDIADFVSLARSLKLDMPILGPDLFSGAITGKVGAERMRGVTAVSTYGGEASDIEHSGFIVRYTQMYGSPPDLYAAVGFDAINLLAYAAGKTGSRDMRKIADKLRLLRHSDHFVGATGTIAFDVDGLVTDTDLYIVRHDGTGFRTVASYVTPRSMLRHTGPAGATAGSSKEAP